MAEQYLMDTNPIIDFFNARLPENGKNFIATIDPAISVISHIELLSNKNIPLKEWEQLQEFIKIASVYALQNEIVERTIVLRQTYKLKLLTQLLLQQALCMDLL